ncbi:MAG: sugar ABC transporter permease [Spirochaetales bacterium]|nr:sugar ABC transporter permease [Spirochaetales bacterium]
MLIPGLVLFTLLSYLPVPLGFIYAFFDVRINPNLFQQIFAAKWIGFDNFRYLWATPDAWIITRNTILYNVAFIALGTACSVAVAIALNELRQRRMAKVYQGIMFLPYFFSWVVISYLVFAMLSVDLGFVNNSILSRLGIQPVKWYQDKVYWPFILIFVNLWKYLGYNSVIYFAALAGINPEYYEAAKIDGASKWKQIRHITLPLLSPTIIILTLLGIGRIFNTEFGLFFQVPLNNGALFSVTQTLDTYTYRALIQMGEPGMAAAAGLYQAAVGFVVVIVANFIIRKIDRDKSLF